MSYICENRQIDIGCVHNEGIDYRYYTIFNIRSVIKLNKIGNRKIILGSNSNFQIRFELLNVIAGFLKGKKFVLVTVILYIRQTDNL